MAASTKSYIHDEQSSDEENTNLRPETQKKFNCNHVKTFKIPCDLESDATHY